MKLKLRRVEVQPQVESEAGTLRFPAHAVREWPGPHHSSTAPLPMMRPTTPSVVHQTDGASEEDVMRHPELLRQIEATLDRMQSGIDQLKHQVNNYKFPGVTDEERPRAA